MKTLIYKLFALMFNISRILPVKKNRIALLAPHPVSSHDSLDELGRFLEKKGGYEIRLINVPRSGAAAFLDFFINKSRILATSGFVFLNDNFMPMADLHFSPDAVITQLWHGEGAFKKFGLQTALDEKIRKREIKGASKLTYIVCTSSSVAEIYAEAFGADKSKVLPLGSPRIDCLLSNHDTAEIRRSFDEKFPQCKGRKLVLYAPTFRDSPERDRALTESINTALFKEKLGDEYSLLVKLHPRIHSSEVPSGAVDVTGCDISDLTLICDILITDYSSVCMDFALLEKPCIFYAFDLDEYENERDFCFGYRDYVPGPVTESFGETVEEIKNLRSSGKAARFRELNFDYIDNKNCERIYEKIIKASSV